jgi:hypothetical protein
MTQGDMDKAPSRTPYNVETSDDSSSDSNSDSDSSDEYVKDGDDDAAKKVAKKRRQAKKKKEAKKMVTKLLKKMIKRERAKHSPSGYYEVPSTTHNFRATILMINYIPYIWESLPTLMGKTIPYGLMI